MKNPFRFGANIEAFRQFALGLVEGTEGLVTAADITRTSFKKIHMAARAFASALGVELPAATANKKPVRHVPPSVPFTELESARARRALDRYDD